MPATLRTSSFRNCIFAGLGSLALATAASAQPSPALSPEQNKAEAAAHAASGWIPGWLVLSVPVLGRYHPVQMRTALSWTPAAGAVFLGAVVVGGLGAALGDRLTLVLAGYSPYVSTVVPWPGQVATWAIVVPAVTMVGALTGIGVVHSP